MYCYNTDELRAFEVPNRNARTLRDLIIRNVFRDRRRGARKTKIITDGWPGYAGLRRAGYLHTANVGAAWRTDGNSTNAIERSWSILRRLLATYNSIPGNKVQDFICEAVLRRNCVIFDDDFIE